MRIIRRSVGEVFSMLFGIEEGFGLLKGDIYFGVGGEGLRRFIV